MYKPINKLTEKDKLKILAAYRNYAIRNYGMEWDEWVNHVIQKEIDIIFNDKNLNQLPTQLSTQLSSLSSQLSSMEYIRALEAREYFKWSEKHEKPNVLDFLIWRDMKRADGTNGADNSHDGTNGADGTDNSVGMVYVPSKMPVRAELKQSKTANPAKSEKSEKAGKTAKTAKTTKKASSRRKRSQKLDMMNRMLDKLFNAYIETDDGSLLPIHVPDEYFDEYGNVRQNEYLNYMRSHMRTEMLRNNLRKATRAIQTHLNPTNPTDFCKHPDFLALIDMAVNMNGAFRLTVSFPASFLKNKEKLELLPLPVTIGKVQKITDATGNDEDMVTFDWFSTDNPEPDAETMKLISEFIGTMLEAMGIV